MIEIKRRLFLVLIRLHVEKKNFVKKKYRRNKECTSLSRANIMRAVGIIHTGRSESF